MLTAETILDLREHRDVTYKAGGEGATNLKSPAKGLKRTEVGFPRLLTIPVWRNLVTRTLSFKLSRTCRSGDQNSSRRRGQTRVCGLAVYSMPGE